MRSRVALFLVAGLLPAVGTAGPAGAQGCGPTRLKVSDSVVLPIPAAQLWRIVGGFQDMSWDGDVVLATGRGGDAIGAARSLKLRDGSVLAESLFRYDGATMSYATHWDEVALDRLPVQNAAVTLDVAADGEGRARLTWRAAFYRLLKPGETSPDAADAEALRAMAVYLRSGLAGLKARAEAVPHS